MASNLERHPISLLADTWAHNRGLYPGWLIAPEPTRAHLREFTTHWIDEIVASLPSLGPTENLRVWDELNWRLETAMSSLWPELVTTIEKCLLMVDPNPDRLRLESPVLKLTAESIGQYAWDQIQKQWLRLAFAVLRFEREERHRTNFATWETRLSSLIADDSEWKARLCYESCLFHLSWAETEKVSHILKVWPKDDRDPIWKARRAAVLLEIGEIGIGGQLAEVALQEIRRQTKDLDDFASLSREAWAMLLVNGFRFHSQISGERSDTPSEDGRKSYYGRWDRLARFGIDPRAELKALENAFSRELVSNPHAVSRSSGFQPGTYRISFGNASIPQPELLAAYEYMRAVEEAPLPPSCGDISLSARALGIVAKRLSGADPVRTHTIICRLDSKRLVDEYLTRSRVAAMSMETVHELLEVAKRKVDTNEIRLSGSSHRPRNATWQHHAREAFETGLNMMGKLAVRLQPGECDKLLTYAMELYRSPAIQTDISLPRILRHLFESLLLTMRPEDIFNRTRELVSLPVPGSNEFPVVIPSDWPIIVNLLPDDALGQLRGRSQPEWTREIGCSCFPNTVFKLPRTRLTADP